ncbi:MAG: hypothetical protein WKF40_07070 [Thermoleophilaceae bacterium]
MPPDRLAPPNPPTGLSATTLADGTTQLSWVGAGVAATPPPSTGSTATASTTPTASTSTGSATETTYVDDPGGTTHTYYVTAVSDNLAESTMTGPVTK